jgi:hypothetical protein
MYTRNSRPSWGPQRSVRIAGGGRRLRRRFSGMGSFGHGDRREWLEALWAIDAYYRLVAMYSYWKWRDSPLLTGIKLSIL